MTTQIEVSENPKYIPLLDYGFVGLIDHMGDDVSITQAARVSYGTGTKSVNEDRGLIRYLMRHHHTSPIEMVVFKFHIKIPIFVMRQLVRHRTASMNEYSGRYSIMSNEFYLPDLEHIQPQSQTNKQGRAGEINEFSKHGVQWLMQTAYEHSYKAYEVILGDREGTEDHYDPYADDSPLLSADFPGIARESARAVLPVANYTECYWKLDLSNLFRLLKLRRDAHAQYEIRVLADAMYSLISPIVPHACEAARDYLFEAQSLSRMDMMLLKDVLANAGGYAGIEAKLGDEKEVAQHYGMSPRELRELKAAFNFVAPPRDPS